MNKDVQKFDWPQFSAKAKALLKFASASSRAPINADRWEEVIFHVLKSMGMKYKGGEPKWEVGSHAPGADIWIDQFSISAKAGKLSGDTIEISSYRLTRFEEIEVMKEFIDGEGKNFDIYLCCARLEMPAQTKRIYRVYRIPADAFKAGNLSWQEISSPRAGSLPSGWRGRNEAGVTVEIRKKMSNQLWIKLPLTSCTQLLELEIDTTDLGVALELALKEEKLDLKSLE